MHRVVALTAAKIVDEQQRRLERPAPRKIRTVAKVAPAPVERRLVRVRRLLVRFAS